MFDNFMQYFLMFMFFCIVGYIAEILYVFINSKQWINRGFLNGPYIPIYGIGSIAIIYLLNPLTDYPILIFLLGMIICSCIEYCTSFIMEIIFHQRWWDYSGLKYNINGRICLKNSILFGMGAIVIIYYLSNLYIQLINIIPKNYQIWLTCLLLTIFIIDVIASIIEALKINKLNEKFNIKQISKRLFKAYPNIYKNSKLLNKIYNSLKK